ncbi:ABC transporter permease [Thermodesulfobacteriota bacterium]
MSLDIKIAWRNIWRNPRRSILTISAVAFACMILVFMLSFQFGTYETMINSSLKIRTGHLQVQADTYQDKRDMRLVIPSPSKVGKILKNTSGIAAYTFRASAFSLISSEKRTYGALVVGIDPGREAGVSTLPKLIREGSYLTEKDRDEALIGRLLAKNLQVKLGDELILLGQGRDGSIAAASVKIKGIYSSGIDEFDRSSIQIPMKNFQDVYSMRGAVHEIVVIANHLGDVSGIKTALGKSVAELNSKKLLVTLDWQELMPGLIQGIKIDLIGGIIFYFLLIIVVAFSILNTFLMAFLERTREFGVLRAIGITPGRMTRLLLLESLSMTALGIITGIVFGGLITLYFQAHGIEMGGSSELLKQFGISGKMYPKLSLLSALAGPAAVLTITFLTALYPAIKIRRLKPVEAMVYV